VAGPRRQAAAGDVLEEPELEELEDEEVDGLDEEVEDVDGVEEDEEAPSDLAEDDAGVELEEPARLSVR